MTNTLNQESFPRHGVGPPILRIAPLFPVAAGLIIGVMLDHFLAPIAWGGTPSGLVYVIVFVVTSLVAAFRRMRENLGVLLVLAASICAGASLHLNAVRTIPPSGIERYAGQSGCIARLRGRVVSKPQLLSPPENPFARWTYGSERTAFLLQVESIGGTNGDIPVTGRVRVTVGEAVLDVWENERVEVFGRLYRFKPPRNPGSFDWATFYRRQGVVAGMRCNHWENVRRLDVGQPHRRSGFLTWLRTSARGMLTDDLATGSDEEASLLEAMVLGHRSRLDRRLNDIFIRAGCIHFLAVSGIHVVIVMFFARLACRIVMAQPRTCTLVMMLAVIVYAVVAEPRPPILRASIIALLYCVARLLHREDACLNWISASAVVLAILNPETVFDIGFQLSFAAVLGVSYLSPAVAQAVVSLRKWCGRRILKRSYDDDDLKVIPPAPGRGLLTLGVLLLMWGRLRRYAFAALAVTFGAWLAALPLVAVYFDRIYLWGAPSSFIVLPLVSVVMALGFAKLIIGAVSPTLGSVIGTALTAVDSWLIGFVDGLARIPGASVHFPGPPWWVIASYYLLLGALIWRFARSRRIAAAPVRECNRVRHLNLPAPRGACLAAFVVLAMAVALWQWPKTPGRLTVTFLAVGRGSATVIELPDGRTILYDVGSPSPYDVGRNVVVPFLRHRGVTHIDRVYVSHPNLDHFSGLPTVLNEIKTGPIIVNGYFEPRSPTGSPSRHLLDLLADRYQPMKTLDTSATKWEIGGVTFEYLWPPDGLEENISTNNTSTVLRLSYAGRSVLLTGDIEDYAQRGLTDRAGRTRESLTHDACNGNLHDRSLGCDADILALPHHGSVRSSTGFFIKAVGPGAVIRSTSERTEETYNNLQQAVGAVPLYNTADVGAIEVVIDRDGMSIYSPSQL